ncbi:predicted protein [Histoplasma capsulatum G186AR]|uniref:Uncharacterized protein n=1 Tax=Ajellomyces capsulatus (strain G186AR / H82 / ATCC MYA-2454 / RMSCC 2432) TaxID=447093 RepID=C0NNR6_AJECG|nr:uncharacterized protein HCBG_04796 [Histoplasma capsulatum G186AR]EEH06576.1 predicted protein [Histoplasma capsulatum G186AR]
MPTLPFNKNPSDIFNPRMKAVLRPMTRDQATSAPAGRLMNKEDKVLTCTPPKALKTPGSTREFAGPRPNHRSITSQTSWRGWWSEVTVEYSSCLTSPWHV